MLSRAVDPLKSVAPRAAGETAPVAGLLRRAVLASVALSALIVLPVSLPAGATAYPSVSGTTDLVWSTLSPSASPPPLQNATAVYDSDNKTIVLFGGLTSQGTVSDGTWVWNGTTWTDYSPTQIEDPPARYLASMAFDPALHQLILFGGRDAAGRQLNDTWAWNGASWYNIGGRYGNASPSSRDGATLSYDGQGHLVLFGGEGPATVGATPSSSPSGPTQASGTSPTAATGAQSLASGPRGPLTALSDTWQWGPTGWTNLPVSGPPARVDAAAAFDANHGDVVIFGGTSAPNGSTGATQLADTWLWNGVAWSRAPATAAPASRSSAVMGHDPAAGGVVLSGGSSASGALGDTWMWNGSAWSQLPTDGSPGGRTGAAGAFDLATRQLLVFGGRAADGSVLGNTVVLTAGAPLSLGPGTARPATTITLPGTPPSTTALQVPQGVAFPGGSVAPPRGSIVSDGARASSTRSRAIPVLRPGELVTLTGSGFSPDVELTITFHSTPMLAGRTRTDGQGAFVATVAVPLKASNGTHHFEASGLTPSGPATRVVATVVVTAATSASTPSLSETLALVLIALGLPLGTWLLLGARSRIRQRVS